MKAKLSHDRVHDQGGLKSVVTTEKRLAEAAELQRDASTEFAKFWMGGNGGVEPD